MVALMLVHVVRQAWRAWALCQHVAAGRRDVDAIDCFGPSRRSTSTGTSRVSGPL